MLSGPELCSGEAVGEPQCRATKGACLEPHKGPDCPTFLWPLRLQEPPWLLLKKLDPGGGDWVTQDSAHKYGPGESIYLVGVLAGMCGVTLAV